MEAHNDLCACRCECAYGIVDGFQHVLRHLGSTGPSEAIGFPIIIPLFPNSKYSDAYRMAISQTEMDSDIIVGHAVMHYRHTRIFSPEPSQQCTTRMSEGDVV